MSYETITYEKIGHKAVITLNRPESMNSFNRAMSNEMVDVWSAVKSDDDVWVTVLTAQRSSIRDTHRLAQPQPPSLSCHSCRVDE